VKRQVFVDGYNLIRQDPALKSLEQRSLQTAREALLARLCVHFPSRTCDITVIFDGSGEKLPYSATQRYGPVKVIFSQNGESADDVIRALVTASQDPSQVLVLTDDRELRDLTTRLGGQVGGAAERRLPRLAGGPAGSPGSAVAKRFEPDEAPPPSKKGNPRRAKRRRSPPTQFSNRW